MLILRVVYYVMIPILVGLIAARISQMRQSDRQLLLVEHSTTTTAGVTVTEIRVINGGDEPAFRIEGEFEFLRRAEMHAVEPRNVALRIEATTESSYRFWSDDTQQVGPGDTIQFLFVTEGPNSLVDAENLPLRVSAFYRAIGSDEPSSFMGQRYVQGVVFSALAIIVILLLWLPTHKIKVMDANGHPDIGSSSRDSTRLGDL